MICERDVGGRGGLTAAHWSNRSRKGDDLKSVHTDHMLRSDLDANSPPLDVLLQCIQLTYLLSSDLYYGMRVCKDVDGVAMKGRCRYDQGSDVQDGWNRLIHDHGLVVDQRSLPQLRHSQLLPTSSASTLDLDFDIPIVP
jgi:hypothetical protein